MDFAAIDFETANEQRCSPCAVGVVVVRDSEVAHEFTRLIRPPELRFSRYNTTIHGICEEDVVDQPEFDKVWGELQGLVQGLPLVAHNASFDISVLTRTLGLYGIGCPDLSYACTRMIAKEAWPGLPSYNLATVAHHLGIRFQHHQALDDARACAQVALRASEHLGVASVDGFCRASRSGPVSREGHLIRILI